MCKYSSDSSSSFSSSPSVITSAGYLENSETTYSTDNGRNWLVPSRKCTSRNVELNGSFFVRSVFKVTSLCFLFVVILNTIHKQFSFMHQSSKQSNLKTPKRRKNIRIRKFEHDIFWIPFTVTSSGTIRKNQFLKSKFELH